MSRTRRVLGGCVLLPILLVASCAGKIYVDARLYQLPGEVLKSSVRPTQSLDSAIQVAEALDAYVQPRFEILRDRNFGAFRIVFRKHAGIVQLKVDSPREQEIIANVNAANRDYVISLLHCAPKPDRGVYAVTPRLQMLYFNQQSVTPPWDGYNSTPTAVTQQTGFDVHPVQDKAVAVLPELMAGREHRTVDASWAVLMRPVRASKQECLTCHTQAKPGATLGVMVYAVRITKRKSGAQIGLR